MDSEGNYVGIYWNSMLFGDFVAEDIPKWPEKAITKHTQLIFGFIPVKVTTPVLFDQWRTRRLYMYLAAPKSKKESMTKGWLLTSSKDLKNRIARVASQRVTSTALALASQHLQYVAPVSDQIRPCVGIWNN